MSDHLFSFYVNVSHHRIPKRILYNYSKADFKHLSDYLGEILASNLFDTSSCDIDSLWGFLRSEISTACELYTPKFKSQSRKWFNAEIRHLLKRVHTIRRYIKRNPASQRGTTLLTLEGELQELMQSAKLSYEQEIYPLSQIYIDVSDVSVKKQMFLTTDQFPCCVHCPRCLSLWYTRKYNLSSVPY